MTDYLLNEDGTYLLLEDGGKIVLETTRLSARNIKPVILLVRGKV